VGLGIPPVSDFGLSGCGCAFAPPTLGLTCFSVCRDPIPHAGWARQEGCAGQLLAKYEQQLQHNHLPRQHKRSARVRGCGVWLRHSATHATPKVPSRVNIGAEGLPNKCSTSELASSRTPAAGAKFFL
jgi:hypothetical protein